MADHWFRIPEGDPSADATWPAYISADPNDADATPKYDVDGWSGNTVGGSPIYIVRVRADDETLDRLAKESRVTELTDTGATDALNNATRKIPSESRTPSEWKQAFEVN